jgi:hypothetical protein
LAGRHTYPPAARSASRPTSVILTFLTSIVLSPDVKNLLPRQRRQSLVNEPGDHRQTKAARPEQLLRCAVAVRIREQRERAALVGRECHDCVPLTPAGMAFLGEA